MRDHKLLFLPEVSGAPGIESFRSTTEKFLKQARTAFIRETIEGLLEQQFPYGANREEKKKTREDVQEKFPPPNLEVISLASEDSLDAFVDRFDKLKVFSVRLVRPNNEINNEGFFDQLRDQTDHLEATSANLNYRNPEGLAKPQVKDQAESALDGNAEIALMGTDHEGRKLSGSNDDFKIMVVVETLPKAIRDAAQKLFSVFSAYKKNGQIRVGAQETTVEKEAKLVRLTKQFAGQLDGND